jgi:GT2 family glycosyltransferase
MHPGKVKAKTHDVNKHISHTSNSCLELADGDYVALLDHDDRLAPHALAEMVRYINLHNQPDILYSDERVIDENGLHVHIPYFKPDYSPQMHLAVNYTTHLTLYKAELVRNIGGFRPGFEGSQDHDLMLRMCEVSSKPVCHVPFCLYQWRAHELSTAASSGSKPYAAVAGEKAVKEALERRGRKAKVQWEEKTLHYRVTYEPPQHNPLISIIIPSKDAYEVIRTCLDSLYSKTSWNNFQVILVDNGSTDPRCLQLFSDLKLRHGDKFHHLATPGPFNFARLINAGVAASRGEYLLMLNNDTAVISPTWLEEMIGLAQWPEIGAVGAKLLYPDGSIQHSGIITTGPYIAGHSLTRLDSDSQKYWSYAQTVHEASGVTAACLMISREKFLKVGGLDEVWIPNGFGDVEFCLRIRRHGLSNVYTPYAVLTHFESKTRKGSYEYFEHFWLRSKYGTELLNDPYLNPSLMPDGQYSLNPWYTGTDFNEYEFDRLVEEAHLWTSSTGVTQ